MANFKIFQSRTVWTIIGMFVVGGVNAIVPVLSPALQTVVMALLGILATYYKLNPSQTYNPPPAA